MATPLTLPPPIVEKRSDTREAFRLVNAIRRRLLSGMGFRVVSANPGDITIGVATGNAIEFFDGDGTSLGVVTTFNFTVNP